MLTNPRVWKHENVKINYGVQRIIIFILRFFATLNVLVSY